MRCDWMQTELLEGVLCSQSGSSSSGRQQQQQGWWQTQNREAALPFLTKRENVELLPNVWWQAVARKSGSLGKSLHKDQ